MKVLTCLPCRFIIVYDQGDLSSEKKRPSKSGVTMENREGESGSKGAIVLVEVDQDQRPKKKRKIEKRREPREGQIPRPRKEARKVGGLSFKEKIKKSEEEKNRCSASFGG